MHQPKGHDTICLLYFKADLVNNQTWLMNHNKIKILVTIHDESTLWRNVMCTYDHCLHVTGLELDLISLTFTARLRVTQRQQTCCRPQSSVFSRYFLLMVYSEWHPKTSPLHCHNMSPSAAGVVTHHVPTSSAASKHLHSDAQSVIYCVTVSVSRQSWEGFHQLSVNEGGGEVWPGAVRRVAALMWHREIQQL